MSEGQGDRGAPVDADRTWAIGLRPTCWRCDRLSVVYDDQDRPLCARHATIFMVDWDGTGAEADS